MNALSFYGRIIGDVILAALLLHTAAGSMRRSWYIPLALALFFLLLGLNRLLTLLDLPQAAWVQDYGLTPAVWISVLAVGYGLWKHPSHK